VLPFRRGQELIVATAGPDRQRTRYAASGIVDEASPGRRVSRGARKAVCLSRSFFTSASKMQVGAYGIRGRATRKAEFRRFWKGPRDIAWASR